jgi:isoaspartyl peptidase/L-asparaginase-like protein (Ntn-hydrolase superfamily)
MGGWAIAVHGGAGVDPNLPLERQEEAKQLLTRVLNLGISALRSNLSAIDVVELVVHVLFCSTSYPHTYTNHVLSCPSFFTIIVSQQQ